MKQSSKIFVSNLLWLVAAPVILLVIWQVASDTGHLNASILPSPTKLATTAGDLIISGKLWRNFIVSFWRVIEGFLVGTFFGILVGSLMGIFPKVNKALSSLWGILMPIPMIGWVPLLILWLGIGEESKVVVIALGTFWSVLMNTTDGIKNVDRKLTEVAYLLKKNRFVMLTKVVIPAALPSIITGIRLGFGNAWKAVISAEMLAATRGIGYVISYARELSKPDVMLVGLFTIGLIGVLIDFIFLKIQKVILRWN